MLLSTQPNFEQISLSSLDEAVNRFPLTVKPNTPLIDAIALMSQHQVGYMLVMEDLNIFGWFSAKDLINLIAHQVDLQATQIREVVTDCVIVSDSTESDNQSQVSLSLLQDHELIAVVDNQGNLQGVITPDTICKALRDQQIEGNKTDINTYPTTENLDEIISSNNLQFSQLLDTSAQHIWILKPDGCLEYLNQWTTEYSGINRDGLLNRGWQQLLHPDDLQRYLAQMAEHISIGEAYEIEIRLLKELEQNYRWHIAYLQPLKNSSENVVNWFITMIDIHERKLTEATWKLNSERFETLIENHNYLIWEVDEHLNYTYLSPSVKQIWGYEPEDLLGKTIFTTMLSHEGMDENNLFADLVAFKQKFKRLQTDFQHQHGHDVIMEISGSPIFAVDGSYCGYRGNSYDITQYKQMEIALVRSRQIIENSPDGISITDLRGKAIYHNPMLTKMFGYNVNQINALGGSSRIFFTRREATTVLNSAKHGEGWQGKVKTRDSLGHSIHAYLRTNLIKNDQNEVVAVTSNYTDISHQKHVEDTLRLRDRALAASTNGIIITDARLPNLPIVYVNQSFEKITGYSACEVIGRNSRFLQKSDHNQPALEELQTAIDTHQCCTVLLRNYRKDGVLFWNELSISPVFDVKQKLTHYIGIINDVSDRKQSEVAIRVSKARLEYLLFSTPGAVYTSRVSGDFGVTFVSENISNMLGYQAREFVKDSNFWINHIHPDDQVYTFESISQLPLTGKNTIEYRFLHKDGNYRWLLDSSKVLYDEAGNSLEIIGFCIDITERKQLEEDLRIALEKEKELSELKSRFVSMTSHEFRTPLSTILSSSELLEHYRHNWSEEKQLSHFHRIQSTVKHMTQLLNDVLIIGKAEAGKAECEATSLDLVSFCNHLVAEMQLNNQNTQQIIFECSAESIIAVMDEKLLGHINTFAKVRG
ncbi:PAS domain S-box protein [Calothrix sp. PCC 6303]|uniref:PAS domain S-box protein n=1 Tax=Calothrix sp. PCC 6303 TaxID=1170562 RepID=UPI0002A04CB3|nr:PAS domain S-box protein [Calothrix sp. PCC 6303]AFZ04412.1 putative PAS/PAC sensor protein [Calothrix sp. PCC 6303]